MENLTECFHRPIMCIVVWNDHTCRLRQDSSFGSLREMTCTTPAHFPTLQMYTTPWKKM